jgi:hypothetical protein
MFTTAPVVSTFHEYIEPTAGSCPDSGIHNLRRCKRANEPQIFFLSTEFKTGKQNIEIFSKQVFGWCKDRKIKNLRFTGCRIETSELRFYKGRGAVNSVCSLPKVMVY